MLFFLSATTIPGCAVRKLLRCTRVATCPGHVTAALRWPFIQKQPWHDVSRGVPSEYNTFENKMSRGTEMIVRTAAPRSRPKVDNDPIDFEAHGTNIIE